MFSIDFPSVQDSINLILKENHDINFEFSSLQTQQIYEILAAKEPKSLFCNQKTIKAVFDAKRIDLLPKIHGFQHFNLGILMILDYRILGK